VGRAGRNEPRRRPGERAGLQVESVLEAARNLIARDGIQRFTMRGLATELGVAPNAVYSYFDDKAALLDALVDHLLANVEVPDPTIDDWRVGLRELMRSSRRTLLAHADLLPHMLARPTRGPNAIRLGEATLTLLERGGIEGASAVEALRVLLTYTLGFVAQELPRRQDPRDASLDDARRAETVAAFQSLADAPRMAALAEPLSRVPGDAVFDTGLAWLISGIDESKRGDAPQR
jgi:TetR/AcrR family tetracycline transcriptional repressor